MHKCIDNSDSFAACWHRVIIAFDNNMNAHACYTGILQKCICCSGQHSIRQTHRQTDRRQKCTSALLWGHPPAGPPQDPLLAWGRVLAQQADCTYARHWMAGLPAGGGLRALRLPALARAVSGLQHSPSMHNLTESIGCPCFDCCTGHMPCSLSCLLAEPEALSEINPHSKYEGHETGTATQT